WCSRAPPTKRGLLPPRPTRQTHSRGVGLFLVGPVLHAPHTSLQLVADLVHPKPLYFPTQLYEPLIAKLGAQAQLTGPAAVIAFAIHLNRELPAFSDEREIKVVLFDAELRNRLEARRHHRPVEHALPLGYTLRVSHRRIVRAHRDRRTILCRCNSRVQGGDVLDECLEVVHAARSGCFPVPYDVQQSTGPRDRHIEEVTVASQEPQRARGDAVRHHRRKEHHVPLVTLKLMDRID